MPQKIVMKDGADDPRRRIKLEDTTMKKAIALLLAVLTACSLAACAAKASAGDTSGGEETVKIADALTLLNGVWDAYSDDEKFPAAGGDYDEANMTNDAPGKVGLENAENVEYLLSFPQADVEKVDDAASLIHMMNGNTFTCGAFRLTDAADAGSVAADVKEYVMAKQWMCGFPDKLVVANVGGYLVEVYGAEDLVNTFRDKLSEVYPDTVIVSDDPIA